MITFDKSEAEEAIFALSRTGFVDEHDNPEHVLHEICHAVLLGAKAPFVGDLSAWVANQLRFSWFAVLDKTLIRHDWQEILTCAAELRAAELLGWGQPRLRPDLGRDLTIAGVLDGNTNVIERETAQRLIARLIETETAYQRARKALDFAVVTARYYTPETHTW